MPLVFQYGSNMSAERLNAADRLAGTASMRGPAQTVDEFELEFTVWSTCGRCAAANIRPVDGGRSVWGVLYDVPEDALEKFDRFEGPRYRRAAISVAEPDGTKHDGVTTWVVRQPEAGLHTSQQYVGYILAGLASQPAIPKEYLTYVRARIALNNPALQLPDSSPTNGGVVPGSSASTM